MEHGILKKQRARTLDRLGQQGLHYEYERECGSGVHQRPMAQILLVMISNGVTGNTKRC